MVTEIRNIEATDDIDLEAVDTVGPSAAVKYPDVQKLLKSLPEVDPGKSKLAKGEYALFPKVETANSYRLPTRQIQTAAGQLFGAKHAERTIMTRKIMHGGEPVIMVWRVKLPKAEATE
jgi:hypothetical protein